jgi:hypothetical protein
MISEHRLALGGCHASIRYAVDRARESCDAKPGRHGRLLRQIGRGTTTSSSQRKKPALDSAGFLICFAN